MFKKLTEDARLPERATKYSAGFDVFANEDVVIGAGETKLIGLGIALDNTYLHDCVDIWAGHTYPLLKQKGTLSKDYDEHLEKEHQKNFDHYASIMYLALHIRSSLRAKGLTSLGTGIIDMDYHDEIKMVIHNPIRFPDGANGVFDECNIEKDFWSIVSKVTAVIRTMFSRNSYQIKKGDKIGQLILCRHEGWLLPSEYTKDEERNGGFGSTGG